VILNWGMTEMEILGKYKKEKKIMWDENFLEDWRRRLWSR
jgi:hypothetical protein